MAAGDRVRLEADRDVPASWARSVHAIGSFGKYHGAHQVIDRITTYKPTIAHATAQVFQAGTQPVYQLTGIPCTGPEALTAGGYPG